MDLITVVQKQHQEFEVQVRKHRVASDMALADGGQDHGFRPTELLVGALGACIGKALARYCETIHCASEGIQLYLTYEFADNPRRVQNIVIDIELPKDFPPARREAIPNIIKACPVHNTLNNPPRIDVEITA